MTRFDWRSPGSGSAVVVLAVEGLIFAAGVVLYLRATWAKDRAGRYGFWGLVTFLVVVHLANLFGPPPPSTTAIAWTAQAQWLLVAWACWIDRHRMSNDG